MGKQVVANAETKRTKGRYDRLGIDGPRGL